MTLFVWDRDKEIQNRIKHGVDFDTATLAFEDSYRQILYDSRHSLEEERFFCFGKVAGEVLTVRFTYRENDIRIIGAGYWRKGKSIYEKKKKI